MLEKKYIWPYGAKSELARRAGIHPQNLSDIIHGRRRANVALAVTLARCCRDLGLPATDRLDWLYPEERSNPLVIIASCKE